MEKKQNNQGELDPREVKFNKDLPTALFIARDKGGCGYYRCSQPASFLRTRGLMNTIIDFKDRPLANFLTEHNIK